MFDTKSAYQRTLLTGDDIAGPLDMLFDFGELGCAMPVDPSQRPTVLFGSDTYLLGTPEVAF